MSQQYEYMETSLNYVEDEETFEPLKNTVQENQNFKTDVEVAEEQNVENEISKLRYQDADALIQAEIKEIIFKKETQKTTVKVLNEHKNSIMQQIKDLQDLRDIVGEENEALNVSTEIEKEEMLNLQKRLTYNGEIIGRLKVFMKTMEDGFKQLEYRDEQYLASLKAQTSKILNYDSQYISRIAQLKADINNKNKSSCDERTDPIKTRNDLLKAKIIERREYLNQLKERSRQIEIKKENIKELTNRKEEIENMLNDRNVHLQTLKESKKQKEVNANVLVKELDVKIEEKVKSLNDSRQILENINKEISEAVILKDSLSKDMVLKVGNSSQLDEKISKIKDDIKVKQEALDGYIEICKGDINVVQDKLETTKNELTDIANKNSQLSSSLELVRQKYIAKMEEKGNNLLLKLELEKKLGSEEILLAKIRLLEEQITLKNKTPVELLEKIEKLSTDDALQDLSKKKAYLISSTDYLNEKLENVRKELENMKKVSDDLQVDMASNTKSIQEKQEKYDALLAEFQKQQDDVDEHQLNTSAGILKSTIFSQKKLATSPKKVQFEGLSSYESSTGSEIVNLSGSNRQTIQGKTFDDILEEIQADSFKEPLKTPKKRKIDIDID